MASKGTILIIEDNRLNLDMVKDLLEMAEYQTLEAEEAVTGMELAKEHQPDLILMDMHLPIMDGYEATRKLKADPKTQAIPVVAFTALAMEDEQKKALAVGSIGIICKPFDAKTFAKTVESFLSGEHPLPAVALEEPAATPVKAIMEGKAYYSKILIVDDQPQNVQMLTDMLSNMDQQALQAFSGQEALDIIRGERPDLILLDIMMPEMDGFTVLRHLKAEKAFEGIPVIIISALADIDSVIKGLDEGAYDYITKPYNIAEVQARIRAALKTKQLIAAVEQSSHDMEQFLMVASHDLQGPLRKIQQFSGFLRQSAEKKLDSEDMDFLNKIDRNAIDMEELLKELLTLSRINRKGGALKPTDLNDAVGSAISHLEGLIQAEKATIEMDELPTVDADPIQMRMLFEALIDNGLKFRQQDQPYIRIKAESENGTCHVTVQDNGIGFDEAHKEAIFKPFHRLHGTSKYPGNGMGLAIAQKIVERHHGTITATSKLGVGSTFSVRLPLSHSQ